MVFSCFTSGKGASGGGFLWKAPGCENRASQSGLRGCVNRGSRRASLLWIGPLQTETMSQPQEPIHVPPSGIISQTQSGKCTSCRSDGRTPYGKNIKSLTDTRRRFWKIRDSFKVITFMYKNIIAWIGEKKILFCWRLSHKLAGIFMSASVGVEEFGVWLWQRETFSSSPVCVSGEAGASHSTKEYLSFQLVRWIKWPSRRAGREPGGQPMFEREKWGDGENAAESGHGEKGAKAPKCNLHLQGNKTTRMT